MSRRELMIAFSFWFLGVFTIVGCASAWKFPYPYYAEQMEPSCYDAGQLLGKSGSQGWPDLSLKECKPDEQIKLKCMVVKVDDFYSMKSDDEKTHAALDSCQRQLDSCHGG